MTLGHAGTLKEVHSGDLEGGPHSAMSLREEKAGGERVIEIPRKKCKAPKSVMADSK